MSVRVGAVIARFPAGGGLSSCGRALLAWIRGTQNGRHHREGVHWAANRVVPTRQAIFRNTA